MKDNMTRDRQSDQQEDPDSDLINMGNGIRPMSKEEIDAWAGGILDHLRKSAT